MNTLWEPAYAKLNLTLDVLGKRPDGYHELVSVMQTVSLCDDVGVLTQTGAPWELRCAAAGVPLDRRNLAWRAAEAFFDEARLDPNGLTIRINKRVPMQAGLAGGSADAAAVLRALNRRYDGVLPDETLLRLAGTLGSDVPFCVRGGTALAHGRGERLERLPDAPELWFVLCKPETACSTPELFAALDRVEPTRRPDTQAMCRALADNDAAQIGRLLCNVFEAAALPLHPELAGLKSLLSSCGALGAQMTGSGSVVFGIFASEQAACAAWQTISEQNVRCFAVKSV